MRSIIWIIVLLVFQNVQAQYREFFDEFPLPYIEQSKEIYKQNKVKKRHVYTTGFGKSTLEYTLTLDKEGRTINMRFLRGMSIYKREVNFEYNSSSNLSEVYDVYTKSKDGKFYQEFIRGDKELMEKFKNAASKKIIKYQIENIPDSLVVIYRIEQELKDTISYSTYHLYTGLHHYKEFEKNGIDFIMEYKKIENFEYVPVQLNYLEKKKRFEYHFDDKMRISHLTFESYRGANKTPYNKEYFTIEYNEKGLIKKIGSFYYNLIFEYEYY